MQGECCLQQREHPGVSVALKSQAAQLKQHLQGELNQLAYIFSSLCSDIARWKS